MTTTVNSNFIQGLYFNVLQSIGTADEIESWVAKSNAGMTAPEMVNSFINSADGNRVESIIRLYDAFFNRNPDSDGLYYWTNQYNNGSTLRNIAIGFGASPEFQNRFIGFSTAEFVETIYNNLYNRASDPTGKAFWINQVDSGAITRTDVALFFAESPEALSDTGLPTRSADSYLVLRAAGINEPTLEEVDALASSTLSEAIDEKITSFTPKDDVALAASLANDAATAAATAAAAAAALAAATAAGTATAELIAAAAVAEAAAVAAATAAAEAAAAEAAVAAAAAAAVAQAAAVAAAAAAAAAAAGGSGGVYSLTTGQNSINGTVNNDVFISSYDGVPATDTLSSNDLIDGLGGTDTLIINHLVDVAITPPDSLWTGLIDIEKVTINTTGNGAQTLVTGAFFNTAFSASGVVLKTETSGAGAINIDMSTFTGVADISTVSLAGAQTIVAGGGATTVTASSAAGALTIYGVGLSTVTATTTGAGAQTIGNAGGGGASLVSVTTDSNGGAQTITSTSDASVSITSTSITGSINTISALGIGAHTIIAGGGNDLITGGSGVDTITGGAGIDTFAFGSNGSLISTPLSSFLPDIITDYKAIDRITFGGNTALVAADLTATVAGVNVQNTAGGLITFAAGDNTLSLKIAAVQADAELDLAGTVAIFIEGGNTYLYYSGVATGNIDDQLVQLTGVVGTSITAGATTAIALAP